MDWKSFPYGMKMQVGVEDLDIQRREYQGHEYYVPSGMRSFKGTEFSLVNNIVKLK